MFQLLFYILTLYQGRLFYCELWQKKTCKALATLTDPSTEVGFLICSVPRTQGSTSFTSRFFQQATMVYAWMLWQPQTMLSSQLQRSGFIQTERWPRHSPWSISALVSKSGYLATRQTWIHLWLSFGVSSTRPFQDFCCILIRNSKYNDDCNSLFILLKKLHIHLIIARYFVASWLKSTNTCNNDRTLCILVENRK